MSYHSSENPTFNTIESWIQAGGEVSVLIRYSHSAGLKDFAFFSSFAAFRERISNCAPRTCFTVFREPQLSHRGTVDDNFIKVALEMIPNGEEYLIAGLGLVQHGKASWYPFSAGNSITEMRTELNDFRGSRVACGVYPPWLEDNNDVMSAVVPHPDGTVKCGIY